MKRTSDHRRTNNSKSCGIEPAYRPGYMSVRRALPEAVKLQTGLDVTHLVFRYLESVDKWVKTRGKRNSVLRLKEVYLLGLRSMTDNPFVSKYWISTNSRGFPKEFDFLEKFYFQENKSPQALQAVLSILGYYRAILAPGIPDFSSITELGPDIPQEVVEEIFQLGFDPNWKINPKRLDAVKIKLRSKKGPNGQATVHAFTDLACLSDELIQAMKIILTKSDDEDNLKFQIPSIRKKLQENKAHHSRLAIKREKGGKDRVFAMVDYWTQIILEPLHHGLSRILKQLNEDSTFDQSNGINQMKEWTSNGSAISIDLTSASDRIPASVQTLMLEKLTGDEEFAKSWYNLMVNREFYYKGKTFKWNVGQPLGAHSSWPSFALLHHIVMRASYRKAGLIHHDQYRILGDDMAAKNSEAIPYYLDYLSKLGVEISPKKGLSGYSIEFAKRIFYKGYEVSPLPIPQLEAMLKDISLITEFLTRTKERMPIGSLDLRVPSFLDFISCLTNKDRETLAIIAEYPLPQMRYILNTDMGALSSGVTDQVVWNSEVFNKRDLWRVFNQVRYRYLIRQLDALTKSARINQQKAVRVELPSTPKGIQRMHPLLYSFGNYFDEVEIAKREVRGYLTSPDRWSECPMVHVTNVTSLIRGSKRSARHSSKLLLEVWKELHKEPPA